MRFIIRDGKRYWYRVTCKCGLVCKITMPGPEYAIIESCDDFRNHNNICTKKFK